MDQSDAYAATALEAWQLLAANRYAIIATATPAGTPWVSPVFFAYDSKPFLYWVSNRAARHSHLIAGNPSVAITVFDPAQPEKALYLEAEAGELEEPDLDHPIEVFNARADPEKFKIDGPRGVMGEAAWRLYRATPPRAFLLGSGRDVGGQHVDTRDEIDLAMLRGLEP